MDNGICLMIYRQFTSCYTSVHLLPTHVYMETPKCDQNCIHLCKIDKPLNFPAAPDLLRHDTFLSAMTSKGRHRALFSATTDYTVLYCIGGQSARGRQWHQGLYSCGKGYSQYGVGTEYCVIRVKRRKKKCNANGFVYNTVYCPCYKGIVTWAKTHLA